MTAGVSRSTAAPGPTPNGLRRPDGFADLLATQAVEQAMAVLPSSRRVVHLPVYVRDEVEWTDELPREFGLVPNRPAYALDGAPLYPELVVVRLLERAGWGAAWRKTWNGAAYWRGVNDAVEPSALSVGIVDQVTRQAGYVGPWDILAWRGRQLRLLASRPAGGQRVTAYMADWLDAALRMGIPLGCFAVVEHRHPRRKLPRRR